MNIRKVYTSLILLFGEIIIIVAFIRFSGKTSEKVLFLNILVSSIAYILIFNKYRAPWLDLKDRSHKKIGALGISWFVAWAYAVCAISVIVASNLLITLSFSLQLIIHCILFFFVMIGISGAYYSKDKTLEVYEHETDNRKGISEMRAAMQQLRDKINEIKGLPASFTDQIIKIEDDLRFISPSNNEEANTLDLSLTESIHNIRLAISDYDLNKPYIEDRLKAVIRLYENRKNISSI